MSKTADTHIIRYEYPGTTNGQPVGTVYVTGPWFGIETYSHTYKVEDAAKFPSRDEAMELMHGKSWPRAIAVPLASSVDLPQRVPHLT